MALGTTAGAVWVDVLPSMKRFGPMVAKEAAGAGQQAGKRSGGMFATAFARSTAGPLRATLGTIGKTAAGIFAGVAVGGFLKDAISQASDLSETVNKSNVIFGENAAEMRRWAQDAASSFGLSRAQALEAAAGFGNMFSQLGFAGDQAMEMSQQVVQLSTDLGSFNNLPTAEVADMMSAAFRGEYDSLQRLIPNINAARVEQEALAMTGKESAKSLTAQEKAAATLAIVQRDGAAAAGDFAETSGGLANASKILGARFQDVKATLGNALVPVLATGVTWVSTFLGEMEDGEGVGGRFADMIGVVADRAEAGFDYFKSDVLPVLKDFGGFIKNDILPVLGDMAGFVMDNRTAFELLFGVIAGGLIGFKAYSLAVKAHIAITRGVAAATGLWTAAQRLLNTALRANPIGIVITVLAALAAGLVVAYKRSETFRNIVDNAWKVVSAAVQGAWENYYRPIFRFLGEALKFGWEAFKTYLRIVKEVWSGVWAAIKWAWGLIKPALTSLWDAVKFGWQQFERFRDIVSGAWDKIREVVAAGVRAIVLFFIDMAGKVLNAADKAFGWIPGLGGKLDSAKESFRRFRDGVNAELSGIKDRNIEIRTQLDAGAKYLAQSRNISASEAAALARKMFRAGGAVHGAGTGTSDSIPAWLSNGEHVWTAREVANAGGHQAVEQMRRQFRYANGGPVEFDISSRFSGTDNLAQVAAAINAGAARLESASRQQVAVLEKAFNAQAKASASVTGGAIGSGPWRRPLSGYRVSSEYGQRWGRLHAGIDLAAPTGTPVYAASMGRVSTAGWGGGYGNRIDLMHAGNVLTRYAHLSAILKRSGAVLPGQLIGRVGSTGNSTGPHLHFETRPGNRPVNPRSFMRARGVTFDQGGMLQPGMNLAYNGTGGPEPVLTGEQFRTLERIADRGDSGPTYEIHGYDPLRLARDLARHQRQEALVARAGRPR